MTRPFHRLSVLAALLTMAPCALAQTTRPPLSESLTGEAKGDYTSAKILFNNNDFAGALSKYTQAYEHSKDARLLYDMAICEKNLRHYARMESDLKQYQREAGSALNGEEKQIVEDALAAIKNLVGAVHLTINESDATVSVDGDTAGTTPLSQALVLDLGKHKLTASKAGFVNAEKEIDVAGGSEASVALTLNAQAHVSRLLVSTDSQATVLIDGKVVGVGRFEGVETPGPHEVSVTQTGMRPYKAEVDLRDGERRTLQVTLESEQQRGPMIWPWIVGGAAVAAGAIVGGYLLFKPSDTTTPVPAGNFAPTVTFASRGR